MRRRFFYEVTMNVGQAEVAALAAVVEAFVVDTQKVHPGGVEIMHIQRHRAYRKRIKALIEKARQLDS